VTRKLGAVLAVGVSVALGGVAAPALADDPSPPHSFSGVMVFKGRSTSAHLVDDPSGAFSIMTAGNGCTQEWHLDKMVPTNTNVRRGFGTSHTTAGQSDECYDSSNLGFTVVAPNEAYGMHNGKWNMAVNDQAGQQVSWILDSDG
jgi:hypothetical protein